MQQIEIRWMNIDDLDDWSKMANSLWPQMETPKHRQEILNMINRGSKRRGVIASTDDCHLAGFADIGIRDYANGCTSQPVAYLEGIWIDPDCRRLGIGRSLISFISQWAINEGFIEICSDAEIDNTESHHAHADWGFNETSKTTNFRKVLK